MSARPFRAAAGLLLGGFTAVGELLFVLLSAPLLAVPAGRRRVHVAATWLAAKERSRVLRFLGGESSADYDGRRALAYVGLRSIVGGLGLGVFLLIAWGALSAWFLLLDVLHGEPIGGGTGSSGGDWYDGITVLLFGVLLAFLAVQGLIGVATLERRLAAEFLGPSRQQRLQRRVDELAATRAAVVAAVNDERRRIERDLHDGVQQRLVALGMLIGRARRASDEQLAAELLAQAHDESAQALVDLRDVTWRIYPVALDSEGLRAALESLAERCGVPVDLRVDVEAEPDLATTTVAYFVASEATTNAVKHAEPQRVAIDVVRDATMLRVRITDDGKGGARPDGAGLSGLARRVAAADGAFTVHSPPGGPTVVRAELPCG